LQQPSYLRKDILKGHDETSAVSARRNVCGQTDDRRIREGHHDVGRFEMKAAIACGKKITHIIAEAPRESPFREPGSASADEFNSPELLSLVEKPSFESVLVALRGDERKACHYGDLAPMVPDQALAKLGEKLARGRRVGMEGSVEESD